MTESAKPKPAPAVAIKRRFQRYGNGVPRRSVEPTHPADVVTPVHPAPAVAPQTDPTKKK
jgi:hypothetical protein